MPYPSFHAARVENPAEFMEKSFKTKELTKGIEAIMGKKKDSDSMEIQSYHFDKEKFTPKEAKEWLKEHNTKYSEFEPAEGAKNNSFENPLVKAKTYSGRFLRVGPAQYEDGEEMICIPDRNALMRIAESHKGVPIIIEHKQIDVDNITNEAVGYVNDIFLNDTGFTDCYGNFQEADGWAWADFTIFDQKAVDLINKGWRWSNSYIPTLRGPSGTFSAIPYDYEILNGEANHIAIVEDPRYEGVKIIENSSGKKAQSKQQQENSIKQPLINNNKHMAKSFTNRVKNAFNAFVNAVEEEEKNKHNDDDSDDKKMNKSKLNKHNDDDKMNAEEKFVEIEGEKKPFSEVMNDVEEMMNKHNDDETQEEMTKEELNQEYIVGGKKMTGHEILNMYKKNKHNDDDSDDKKMNDDETQEEIEEIEKKENKFKHNARVKNNNFYALQNARQSSIRQNISLHEKNNKYEYTAYASPVDIGKAF